MTSDSLITPGKQMAATINDFTQIRKQLAEILKFIETSNDLATTKQQLRNTLQEVGIKLRDLENHLFFTSINRVDKLYFTAIKCLMDQDESDQDESDNK